ncbi:Cell cycle serine/threonine-protein kinase cdc5/MSD2 [Nowakowskiella sp. JEL0407]|nr:Cell cycle serine/threonine-protein kinase cdc5/MSD2 [Nowakowskiella sp. JEL0407]
MNNINRTSQQFSHKPTDTASPSSRLSRAGTFGNSPNTITQSPSISALRRPSTLNTPSHLPRNASPLIQKLSNSPAQYPTHRTNQFGVQNHNSPPIPSVNLNQGKNDDVNVKKVEAVTAQQHQQQVSSKEKEFPTPPSIIYDRKLDKSYTRGRVLGEGGFARCYEVTDEKDRKLAAKVVPKQNLKNSKQKHKLLGEIHIHQMLSHPNIVQFYHVFEDVDYVYLILELCENNTLVDLIRHKKRLPEPEVRSVMSQLLSAVQYMHKTRVIHRDLKLGNLMLGKDWKVKIGDFGLAAILKHDGERKKTICGTPNYIAPEVLFDTKNGHSYEVDIWSLGVIMYTLLIGKPPFQTKDVKTIYKRIRENNYEFPPSINVSEQSKSLISALLHTKPECRPALEDIINHEFFKIPEMATPKPSRTLQIQSSSQKEFKESEKQEVKRVEKFEDPFVAPAAETSPKPVGVDAVKNQVETNGAKPVELHYDKALETPEQKYPTPNTETPIVKIDLSKTQHIDSPMSVIHSTPNTPATTRPSTPAQMDIDSPAYKPIAPSSLPQPSISRFSQLSNGARTPLTGSPMQISPLNSSRQSLLTRHRSSPLGVNNVIMNQFPQSKFQSQNGQNLYSSSTGLKGPSNGANTNQKMEISPAPPTQSRLGSNFLVPIERTGSQNGQNGTESVADDTATKTEKSRKSMEAKRVLEEQERLMMELDQNERMRKEEERKRREREMERRVHEEKREMERKRVLEEEERREQQEKLRLEEIERRRQEELVETKRIDEERKKREAQQAQRRQEVESRRSAEMLRSRESKRVDSVSNLERKLGSMNIQESKSNTNLAAEPVNHEESNGNSKAKEGSGRFRTAQILEIMYKNISAALNGDTEDIRPCGSSADRKSDLYVTRWMDHTEKYGLAYQLKDGSFGVYFNDSTSMILSNNNSNFEYLFYEAIGEKTVLSRQPHTLSNYPKHLEKKVALLLNFRKYMNDRLVGENGNEPEAKTQNLDFLAKYARTKKGVVFRLSNHVFQLNLADHTKLVIHPDANTLTYIDKNRIGYHHTLEEFTPKNLTNPNTPAYLKDVVPRLRYARDMILSMVQRRKIQDVEKAENIEKEKKVEGTTLSEKQVESSAQNDNVRRSSRSNSPPPPFLLSAFANTEELQSDRRTSLTPVSIRRFRNENGLMG